MKKTHLFGKRIWVAEDLRLRVSRHFHYSNFLVLDHSNKASHLRGFVCEGTPGTGFFVRSTDSHSYWRFVSSCQKRQKQNVWTLILHKEPDFTRESHRVETALAGCHDELKKRILSSYQNVIGMAKEEELLQRIVRAVKDKIQKRSTGVLQSILMHYKSSISRLEKDARLAQLDFGASLNEAQQEAWGRVVQAFQEVLDSRRIWSVFIEQGVQAYQQVFFDMGFFDYIKSPGDTPVMRDHNGVHYYLYPEALVVARSSVDFDCYPLKDLEFICSDVDISTLAVRPQFSSHRRRRKHRSYSTDALSTLYGTTHGQKVGSLQLPRLNAQFFVSHTSSVHKLVSALNDYKKIHR